MILAHHQSVSFINTMHLLDQSFYARSTEIVAYEILGKIIVRVVNGMIVSGRIIETEAYTSTDQACHAYKGKTLRNAALFGPVGHAYVYFTYGLHYCLNVVAYDTTVQAGGVLIRAIDPMNGIEQMIINRKSSIKHRLTYGPANVAQALAITIQHNGIKLIKQENLYIIDDGFIAKTISQTPRIGISKNKEILWRFVLELE